MKRPTLFKVHREVMGEGFVKLWMERRVRRTERETDTVEADAAWRAFLEFFACHYTISRLRCMTRSEFLCYLRRCGVDLRKGRVETGLFVTRHIGIIPCDLMQT